MFWRTALQHDACTECSWTLCLEMAKLVSFMWRVFLPPPPILKKSSPMIILLIWSFLFSVWCSKNIWAFLLFSSRSMWMLFIFHSVPICDLYNVGSDILLEKKICRLLFIEGHSGVEAPCVHTGSPLRVHFESPWWFTNLPRYPSCWCFFISERHSLSHWGHGATECLSHRRTGMLQPLHGQQFLFIQGHI